MISATQRVPVRTFLIDLALHFDGHTVVERGILALEIVREPSSPYQLLLGRDLLCKGHLTLTFDGRAVFSL